MSCKIIYNAQGEKAGVYDQNGQQSKLFDEILKTPNVSSFEQALEIYKETYSDKLAQPVAWDSSKGEQRLEGAPIVEGATGADPQLTALAEKYAKENGINYKRQPSYVEVDEERAKRIAEEYDKMEHNPQDPKVKEAYENLIRQTTAQYNVLKEAGYKFYFFDESTDPYQGNPWNAMRDLRNNKVMGVFITEAGFGSGATELNVNDNPLLADTGITWGFGSVEGIPKKVLANDLFRAVHDAFGHGLEGAGFRARGEENAWQAHVRLFTGSAVAAITSETRGQNSWLNYGKFGKQNKTAKVEDIIFADQKTGLMPEWTWTEGIEKAPFISGGAAFAEFFAKITNTKDGGAKFKGIDQFLNKSIEGLEKELEAYMKYGRSFQKHIAASIPAFLDTRIRMLRGMTDAALVLGQNDKEVKMLDITSSEGYFTKAWAQLAQDKGVNARADALDAGVTFQRDFNEAPQVPGVEYLLQAWGETFVDPVSGINIPLFVPTKKYEIIHENMGFQFFTPTRDKEIKEVKDMMSEGGLFVTAEKLKNKDYARREILKDQFKAESFTETQIKEKAKTVLKESDEASVGMMDYQFDRLEYEKLLSNNFKYVVQMYSAGNFAGYYASDSLEVINAALKGTGDTTTKYNEEVTPRVIQGSGVSLLQPEALPIRVANQLPQDTQKPVVVFSIIGEKGAQNLDQIEEATFRMDNLRVAKEMKELGKSKKEIKLLTGWELGAENKWKYEISDVILKDISVEIGKSYTLENIIKNSELLKAYPKFKKYKVTFNENGRNSYRRDTNSFEIDARKLSGLEISSAKSASTLEGIFSGGGGVYRLQSGNSRLMSHELSHATQQEEGFYTGGSPSSIQIEANRISGVKETDTEELQYNKYLKAIAEKEKLNSSDRNVIESLQRYLAGDSTALLQSYFNIAGEVEARNVESRINMSAEERREKLQEETEDVSIEDQIFIMNSLANLSVIGEKGASRIEEYKNLLNQAKELEKQGKDYSKTGWLKTDTGDWKYFSNEYVNQFKFKNNLKLNQEQNFEDVIEDNIIFKLYPESKNLKIVLYDNNYKNTNLGRELQKANGAYIRDQNTIFVNIKNADGKSAEHIIGHELNHFAQTMEGFSTGGSKVSVIMYALNSTGFEKETSGDIREYLINYDRAKLSREDKKIFDTAVKVYDAFDKKDEEALLNYYYRIEGEIDSRAVELAITLKNKFGAVNATYNQLKSEILKRDGILLDEVVNLYYKGFEYSLPNFSIIGEKGASKVEEYATSLSQAKNLKAQGITPTEIETQTGWYKNKQGQWKKFSNEFINEFKTKQGGFNKVNEKQNLVDVIEDNILFSLYPEIKNYKIVIYDEANTILSEEQKTADGFTQNIGGETIIYVKHTRSDGGDGRITIPHELTHKIQSIEGFATGGSPLSVLIYAMNLTNTPDGLKNIKEYFMSYDTSNLSLSDKIVLKEAIKAYDFFEKDNKDALYNQYRLLQGEIDARAVQLALKLKDEQGNLNITYSELIEKLENEENIIVAQAIDLFYSGKSYTISKVEPTLKYQTKNGKIFTTYREAILQTQGEEIGAGVNTVEGFKPLFLISTNTAISTTEGFINHMIKSNMLSGETYIEGNKTHYKAQGKSFAKQRINAESVKDLYQKQFGVKAATLNADNTVTINEDATKREYIKITNKNGEEKTARISELYKPFSELKKEYDVETVSSILANKELKEAMAKTEVQAEEFIPENELQQKLITLLKKFGIKTISFENYLQNYSKRNNLPISARALVDLTEKLIAFKDGIVEHDDLVEEVAHLIEASIPKEQKENILRNIHKTREWMQFAQQYSEIYETEEEVRTEIFGKVIANSIKEQFAARDSNETENSIINKIKEFFTEFFERINSFFKESYLVELETINKNVYKNLMNESLDLNISTKGIFFSVAEASTKSTKLYNTAEKVLNRLVDQHREFSKKYKNPSDKVLLERAEQYFTEEDEASKLKGIASIIRVTSSHVESLTKSAANKKEGEYIFSSEENVIFNNLEKRIRPSLLEMKALLDPKNKFQEELIEELLNVTKKLDNLVGLAKLGIEEALNKMVEDIIVRTDMSDQDAILYRKTIKNALTDSQKDTDWLHANIGSLLLARNPILNLAGNVIERMNYQKNENFLKPTKELVNYLTDNNFSQKDWEALIKDGYIINELDQTKVDQLDRAEKAEILNELITNGFPSIKEVTTETDFTKYFDNLSTEFEKGTLGSLFNTLPEQSEIDLLQASYKKEWQNNTKKRVEKYYTEAHIKAMEETTLEVNGELLSYNTGTVLVAKDIDNQYKSETTQIRINANKNLTKADQAHIKEINKRRQADANPRGVDGTLIRGINEVYDENLEKYVIVLDQKELANMSLREVEKVNIIVGLNQISLLKQEFYKKNSKGREIPEAFMSELSSLNTTEKKMEFLENNAYISFPDDYYESFKNNSSLISRLREKGEEDLIRDIRTQQSIISRVLRANSVFNKPSETNFLEMNDVHKKDVRLAQINLEKLYNDANILLKDDEASDDSEDTSENVVNDSYYNHLEDSGENPLDFILKNVTPNGLLAIEKAKKIVSGESKVSRGFTKYFSDTMSQPEKEAALLKFAQSKLLPYLKRTEPVGYTKALSDVKSGAITVEDFVGMKNIIKVSPSISFYEGQDDSINPQWTKNNKAGKPQWTKEYLSKVSNQDYFTFFNLDENGNRKDGETKNQKYWEARKRILEYQDKMIEYNNLTGVQNRYMQPQVRRTTMERVAGTTVKGIKESFADMVQFRPEEQETGKNLSNSLHSIPTYYNYALEDKEELTKNYLYAYMMYGQAASLHKARKENIADIFILEDVLTSSKFETKDAESTRAYMMFKNFMEYNFYGVKENFSLEFKAGDRTLDLGKILKTLNGWAKKTNLAGLTTPVTNLLQSSTQKFMERVVGETIDSKSANEGNKLFMKHASDATKEVMGFSSKSFLNVVGESLGIYNAVHRFEDSQYSKAGRLFLSANSKLHEAANFPVVMRGVMGIISSYKIVDGKIISYNQFKQKMSILNKKGDVDSEWERQEKFSTYFEDATIDGVLDFSNAGFLGRLKREKKIIPPSGKTLEQYLNDKKVAISTKALAFTQRIDSQIPMHQKSIAQRDARVNFFLSHLGFLLSAIPQRIKNRHYNLAEETWQEGSWVTAKNFLVKIAGNPKGFREIYEELDENQKKNLKRTVVEIGFANALALMALALSRYNDDDDDVLYPLALADFFLTRVAAEQIGSTTGLAATALHVVDSPLMLKSKIGDWAEINKLVGTSEERNSYLSKALPFYKDISKFSDPISARQKYEYFQTDNRNLFYNYAWVSRVFKEEE